MILPLTEAHLPPTQIFLPEKQLFDDKADDTDAALVLKYISADPPFSSDEAENAKAKLAADADGKNGIDMLDAVEILNVARP